MSRPHAVVAEVIGPAFRTFLSELAPAERALAEAKGGFGAAFDNGRDSLSRQVQHLLSQLGDGRKVAVQPSPEVCWYAGEAARRESQEWCSGLIFLFAAGHFRRFAEVLVIASDTIIPKHRKATLIAGVRTACDHVAPMTPKQFADSLEGQISETSIRLAVKEFAAKGCPHERVDRRDVTLTVAEAAALRDAFAVVRDRAPLRLQALLATCEFAETALGGLAVQRDIAATPLWHHFSSTGPGW